MNISFSVKNIVLVAICILSYSTLRAQENRFGNWYCWANNARFNEKWGMNNDIQLRGGTNWSQNLTLLVRPGVNYYVKSNQTAAIGYAFNYILNDLDNAQSRLSEHRIWEQYIIVDSLFHIPIQHRFRLEQRFLNRQTETLFAQRARYFFRGTIPISQSLRKPFTMGWFVALQNELFFNIQNSKNLNGSFFDQNRAYAALAYRFSSRYDLEVGYLNQFINQPRTINQLTHIVQLAFYSRL